ncbi:chromatin assembly factor 1 subunit B [Strigomonas culicis]|uniref:Chromatin assembly factor 1 subunit B n=1 Tax=Strigomonas culicis TaxID=28005 RepID=S9VF43_9TRYP|nr:chromatin assembly factor 1 subunit B [Strigomonas culicis]|eukprot:EPY25646.1 chromatin assembly factor 1 subunit B [Strigomonas culicis]
MTDTAACTDGSGAAPSRALHARTLELLWHCRDGNEEAEKIGMQGNHIEGLTSIDLHVDTNRIVTTGGDGHIRLWQLHEPAIHAWLRDATEDMTACCTHLTTMTCPDMPTGARWSPRGNMIASAHCGGKVGLWWRDYMETAAEVWKNYRSLAGHINDVSDLCFSPDSRYLISGSADGSLVVHDLEGATAPVVQMNELHAKFCRGVAWDPWNRYVSSFGNGPALYSFTHVAHKDGGRHMLLTQKRRCQGDFIGELCSLCFRRPSWSPDGMLLAVPFGRMPSATSAHATATSILSAIDAKQQGRSAAATPQPQAAVNEEEEAVAEPRGEDGDWTYCINLYARGATDKLAGRLKVRGYNEVRGVLWAPCFLEALEPAAVAVDEEEGAVHRRSGGSPAAGRRRSHSPAHDPEAYGAWGPADYRMVLAAWTADAVLVYTTDSSVRHSDFTDLHVRNIADVAWNGNATLLYTASLDGYISVLSFGTSLAPAYRLPTFATTPGTVALCRLLAGVQQAAEAMEEGRKSVAAKESQTSSAVVVKKKRKTEKPAVVAAEVGLDQLEAMMAAN